MGKYECKVKIQFSDIDENNMLSTKGLIRILGEIAGVHSDAVGLGLNDIPKTHLTWMVLNWKVKLFSRPSWNSELTIKTWASTFSKAFSLRDFSVYDKDNNKVAIATSKWILVDSEKYSITRISPEIINAFGEVQESVFDVGVNDKEKEPENSKFIYDYQIKRRDIDTNHHVNNLYYVDFAYDALPEELLNNSFDNIEIIYKKQIKLNDKIKCFYAYDEAQNQHIVTIKSEDLNTLHSILKFW